MFEVTTLACHVGKILHPDSHSPFSIDSLHLADRARIRIRGRHVAGENVKPGRLLVLEGGLAVHGPPSRGPVLGVALARTYAKGAHDAGEIILILRQGLVVSDGAVGADLDSVRVDENGRFVATGGEVVPQAVSFGGVGVELNL